MKIRKSGKLILLLALLFTAAFVIGMNANAYFRDNVVLTLSSKNAAIVTLDKTDNAASADAPTVRTHFGTWNKGDAFHASFSFKYTGNITAYQVPQLDIMGSNGINYNSYFTGKYTITSSDGDISSETDKVWADEQTTKMTAADSGTVTSVTYTLTASENLPATVAYLVPEFKCAALQYVKNENITASYRKITDPADETQVGFSDSIGSTDIYSSEYPGKKFGSLFGSGSYVPKTLKFSVTPDNRDTNTKVAVSALIVPQDYKKEGKILKDETITAKKDYSFSFSAIKGMSQTVLVDVGNGKAGHRVYAYNITWPMDGNLSVSTVELDKNKNVLTK